MTDDITREPLARAVLTALARTRGPNDALGSLARTVLSGEADLRAAATHSWHGAALDTAFTEALTKQDALTPDQRTEIQRHAQLLRNADPASLNPNDRDDAEHPEESR
ncbi:hypothetical protein [Micromonospora sp. RTGN7]|uniref:hypothetical protein n=1 Tax=Micromonospora sp. RTGN7 TaxID=3016526 RepID=UPI0029FEEB6B|nr:hypothetical protein [Micromonospora sp. RTGN7]